MKSPTAGVLGRQNMYREEFMIKLKRGLWNTNEAVGFQCKKSSYKNLGLYPKFQLQQTPIV